MAKNRDAAACFDANSVSLLLDTSSIVRIRDFRDVIPVYADYFNLYTLEKNKRELDYLGGSSERPHTIEFSMELIKQLQCGNIKTLRNGAPYVSMPKAFERDINKKFPENNLSYTDKLLLFFASSTPGNVAIVTNDREIRTIAGELGLVAFGAFDLYLIMERLTFRPINLDDIKPFVTDAKLIIDAMTPSI